MLGQHAHGFMSNSSTNSIRTDTPSKTLFEIVRAIMVSNLIETPLKQCVMNRRQE